MKKIKKNLPKKHHNKPNTCYNSIHTQVYDIYHTNSAVDTK